MRPSPTCSGSCQSPVRRLGMWLGLFAALSGAQACVAAGHAIRGTVTGLEPTRLEIRHKSGQRVSVVLTPRTSFRRGDSGASFDDVRIGGRVIVVIDEDVTPFRAMEVRIFSQAGASSHPPVVRQQLPPAGGSGARAYREQ